MDTAIAIRTAVIKDNHIYIEAGGGIVADSVSRLEWQESLSKGRAIFRAAALAEAQLDLSIDAAITLDNLNLKTSAPQAATTSAPSQDNNIDRPVNKA
jgi:hypothetical protein